ncbi:MAG TPA: glycoside hydrolase family 38 C-terminal domain-containing protein [Terriglobia bacterium]|nr:glycoside hydrolase family 38 C-terminal domain-containing protein [Terriglobia bacterium]
MSEDLDRRSFIKLSGLGTAAIVLSHPSKSIFATGPVHDALNSAPGQSGEPWPPGASQYRVDMVAYAHIDAVWLWPWSEAMSVVLSTFRSALDHMKRNPDFAFTESSAVFYKWVADVDPEMLQEIRQRVDEGRWEIAGGWWVEPDVNMPNGESLARQGLYGQRFFNHLFGRQATVGFNPDSFGHTGTLPQILRLQEMTDYVFMRPEEKSKPLPSDIFWWESPDGSRVLTYRIPFSYTDPGQVRNRIQKVIALKEPTKDLMVFYGAGDHGGGATDENLKSIQKIRAEAGAPALVYSTPDKYFSEIRGLKGLDLPVVRQDLQHHAVGCYTAESGIKKDNRITEMALTTAEKIASLGSVLWGYEYPRREFDSAWQKVLFQQFHDSLAGTSLPEHYVQSRQAYGYAREVANEATLLSFERLVWQIPTRDPQSDYLVVFNPHAWATNLDVEYDLDWRPEIPSELTDDRGNRIAHQWVQGSTIDRIRHTLLFQAPLPAFGYQQFRLRKTTSSVSVPSVHASTQALENEHLRISFSQDGTIAIFDKDARQEVFQEPEGGCRAVVLDDPSDTWSHDVVSYSDAVGAFGGAEFRVLEAGPLRGRVRMRTHYGKSNLETDWILYAGSRTIEARCSLDWHEHLKMLKFSFPVQVEDPCATYETAFGYIERKTNGDENPGQRWIDLTGKRAGRDYGLAVINDAKYGYSVLNNNMRISITRGAVYAQHRPRRVEPDKEYIWQDQGIQTFRMWLAPHIGSWQEAKVVRLAEEFTAPVPVLYQGIHGGSKPLSGSFLSVNPGNVIVSALKKAEDGNDLILRCYETDGRATKATLNLAFVHQSWTGNFRPLEIKTLRVPSEGGEIREVNLLEK